MGYIMMLQKFLDYLNSLFTRRIKEPSLSDSIAITTYNDELFDAQIAVTLRFEGGYVNNPSDPGGETNYGITKKVAISYGYTGDMKELPLATAKAIYYANYWTLGDCHKLSQIDSNLAKVFFDTSVNCGIGRANRLLKKSLNYSIKHDDKYIALSDDSTLNPGIWTLMTNLSASKRKNLSLIFISLRVLYYLSLCENPTNFVFIDGWLNRCSSILKGL